MTTPTSKIAIPDRLFFRIGDVSKLLGVKSHVLRYWESEFPIVAPRKSVAGQRVYRRSDVETLILIKNLLHEQRYSIEGARKKIRELRHEGKLASAKQESARGGSGGGSSVSTMSVERTVELRTAALSMVELAKKPVGELFRF